MEQRRSDHRRWGPREHLRRLDWQFAALLNRHARWVHLLEEALHLVAVLGAPGSNVELRAEAVSVLAGALEWYRRRRRTPLREAAALPATLNSLRWAEMLVSMLRVIEHTELLVEMLSQSDVPESLDEKDRWRHDADPSGATNDSAMDWMRNRQNHWFYSWIGTRVRAANLGNALESAHARTHYSRGFRRSYNMVLVLETLKAVLRTAVPKQTNNLSSTRGAYDCAQNERAQIKKMLLDWERQGALQLRIVPRRGERSGRSFFTSIRPTTTTTTTTVLGDITPTEPPPLRRPSQATVADEQACAEQTCSKYANMDQRHPTAAASVPIEDIFMFVADRRGLVMAERLWAATERYLQSIHEQNAQRNRRSAAGAAPFVWVPGDDLRSKIATWISVWRPVIYLAFVPRVAPWSSWLISFMLDVISRRWLLQGGGDGSPAGGISHREGVRIPPPSPLLLYLLREPVYSNVIVRCVLLPWMRRGRMHRFVGSLALGLTQAATKYYFLTAAS
jgi:hypothetical protein